MDLKEQIIKARTAKGYTQETLAQSTNLSLRTIQRIEKGEGSPRFHTLRVLSNFLDLDLLKKETPDPEGILTNERNTISLITYLTLLSAFVPLLNVCVPLSIWMNNQDSKNINAFGKKVVHFQVVWLIVLLLSILLIPLITYFSTGQVAIGKFPSTQLIYLLFVSVNIVTMIKLSSKAIQSYHLSHSH